ncbi:MAG: 3-deoxy-manno-octulosonate cytidylyltransferase [Candidatus Marinimicrobia bacterium]|nr:3-deoxy-manno-octulosonate cytidylyltransferase [Candidatus Neomarinimicrobiota bacterium]
MTAIGIIPARYGSTRLPGKVIMPIRGYPMIHHVHQQARQCASLSRILVATDSDLVADTASRLGMEVILTSDDHQSGTDRVAEVARQFNDEIIVNIQGDEPQLDPTLVDNLVGLLEEHPDINIGSAGSTALTAAEWSQPNVVKVVVKDQQAVAFYRQLPDVLPEGEILRHVGLYAYRNKFLQTFSATPPSPAELELGLEQLRAMEMGEPIGMITCDYRAVAVDTRADWERLQIDRPDVGRRTGE